jgi:hypothetical protein
MVLYFNQTPTLNRARGCLQANAPPADVVGKGVLLEVVPVRIRTADLDLKVRRVPQVAGLNYEFGQHANENESPAYTRWSNYGRDCPKSQEGS